ncbi:hypothetical protein [Pararhizobium sp. LjRoot238]
MEKAIAETSRTGKAATPPGCLDLQELTPILGTNGTALRRPDKTIL